MKFGLARFLKNAAIMTATSLLLRAVGMFFRVYLASKIGSEGMGLYQLIFSVYMLAATFATTGICTAVTRLIADALAVGDGTAVKRILLRAVMLTSGIALLSTAAVYIFSDFIALNLIRDIRAARSLRILSLSLPFMGISSCIRGYFVANRQVLTPSNAQLFEQAVRMAIIISIIGTACDKGLEYASAAVLLGDTAAEAASCIFMYIGYLMHKSRLSDRLGSKGDMKGVTLRLIKIAAPLAGGRYITSALRTAESLMVPERMSLFDGNRAQSVASYGNIKGMAIPVIFFPASFLTSLATLLVPEFSAALASNDRLRISKSVDKCVGTTLSASVIIGALFTVFGHDIGAAFYGEGEVGFYISVLGPLVPLMYLESVVSGCLNGLNQQASSFRYNLLDGIVRVALIWTVLPKTGMRGFIIVMAASNILTSVLCLARLLSVAQVRFKWWAWAVKPTALAAASVATANLISPAFADLSYISRSIAECAVGGIAYIILTVAFNKNMHKSFQFSRKYRKS